jgi:UDP-GlcNAc3NAcA epimerase
MSKSNLIKILTIVGARPQFIKAAAVSRLIKNNFSDKISEIIVHTGQHYDNNMSESFFQELDIPIPKYNLNVGSGTHGHQVGLIMVGVEKVIKSESPDLILVYGDTNSTIAGALVASKTPCFLAHVEAGLRSYRRGMPEEVNRVVTDRLTDLFFCPTVTAQKNLMSEGVDKNIIVSGDVMYDNFLFYRKEINHDLIMRDLCLQRRRYLLVTIHRSENTDNIEKLTSILSALSTLSLEVDIILPLHPRTKKIINDKNLSLKGVRVIDPVSYFTIISLVINASVVLTDSGGLQKEAYFSKTPCVTLRDETEWIETLEYNWNRLVSVSNESEIVDTVKKALTMNLSTTPYYYYYGEGDASKKIIRSILKAL